MLNVLMIPSIRSNRFCAPTACRTSGVRDAASAPRSIASRARLIDSKIDLESLALVSGIGCTGRVAGYVKLDSFHTTHGRAIPFATGIEAREPQAECRGLLGRRRPVRHRRQSSDSRGAAQHRSESHLREQPDLRDDRRPDRADHPGSCYHVYLILTAPSSRRLTCRIWSRRPARSTSRAGPRFMCGNWLARSAKRFRRKASGSSKLSRPARRSTSAATRWAMGSTR